MLPAPPTWMRSLVGLLCGLVAVSALLMAGAALFLSAKPAWLVLAFEISALTSAVVGLFFAKGRFADAPGLTLASIGSSFVVGAFLAWLSVQGQMQVKGSEAPISIGMWMYARVAAGAILCGLGALHVLSRRPVSASYVVKGLFAGVPLTAVAAGAFLMRAKLAAFASEAPGWLISLAACLGGLFFIILFSASVHCMIRAFEEGAEEKLTPNAR